MHVFYEHNATHPLPTKETITFQHFQFFNKFNSIIFSLFLTKTVFQFN